MITVTEQAAAEVAKRLEGQPESVGLRIFISGYGWGGPSLGLALEEPKEKDFVVTKDGARVYFQSHIADAYDGAEFDWEDDMWGGGFTFKHPDMGGC